MARSRVQSVQHPFDSLEVARAAASLFSRAMAMGLVPAHPIDRIDAEAFRALARRLSASGIPGGLAGLTLEAAHEPAEILSVLGQMQESLHRSPSPATEWAAVEPILGAESLARLVGVSASSLRRYAAGARATPDAVAERLHFVALIVGDLAGSYNDIGIRRWFHRNRTLLGGKAPADFLAGEWCPDAEGPGLVASLARDLVAGPAT